ncbi:MAG: PorP/SprF family type IX secretion system membrane protein [Bacteroidales bacterium]|nr:PorP/SprF family type IX secretion system membrane protein [Bacteroidales bacterium]MCF8327431.1 PorP/SprF family type IX secretion system membrane protein [Bacteroidales bacterium]
MSKKLIYTFIFFLSGIIMAFGQQDSRLNFRPFADMYENPAALVNKRQWQGIVNYRNSMPGFQDGAQTFYFGIGGPVGMYKSNSNVTYRHAYTRKKIARHALGAYVVQDNFGHIGYNSYIVNYAQRFPISGSYSFSLGVGFGLYDYQVYSDKLRVKYSNDPTYYQYLNEHDQFLLGDLNLGIEFSGPNFRLGFATKHLANNKVKFRDTPDYASLNETYTGFAKATFDVKDNIVMVPGINGVYTQGIPYDLKISAPFVFHEMFMAGIGYSLNKSVSVETGLYKGGLFIGYSFTINTSELHSFSDLAHQVAVGYVLPFTPDARDKFSIGEALF